MGCQLTKSKKNSQALDSSVVNQHTTTQSTQIYYIDQLQRPKKILKWIPQNIPQLKLQESDLYRRRMQQTF